MFITQHTRMHAIIREYGDIASAMEAHGIRCGGPRWLRRVVRPLVSRVLTVERAARLHGVPLERMLRVLDEISAERAAKQASTAPA